MKMYQVVFKMYIWHTLYTRWNTLRRRQEGVLRSRSLSRIWLNALSVGLFLKYNFIYKCMHNVWCMCVNVRAKYFKIKSRFLYLIIYKSHVSEERGARGIRQQSRIPMKFKIGCMYTRDVRGRQGEKRVECFSIFGWKLKKRREYCLLSEAIEMRASQQSSN